MYIAPSCSYSTQFFYDKENFDGNGGLALAPLNFAFGFFNNNKNPGEFFLEDIGIHP